jgi:hypothetical protein
MCVLTPKEHRQRYIDRQERTAGDRYTKRTQTMQHTTTLLRTFIMATVVGIAILALPLWAQAGVRVSIGVGLPVVVAPAPVVVAPPPPAVVYPAPVIVATPPVVYGTAPVVVRGYYGPSYRHWRHHHYGWRQW